MSNERRSSEGQAVSSEPGQAVAFAPPSAEDGSAEPPVRLEAADGGTPSRETGPDEQADPAEVDGGRGNTSAASQPETGPGVWSRQTIERRAINDVLIADEDGESLFDKKRLDPASYRLAMGREIYISPGRAKEKASVTFLRPREGFFIPPGQFAFLLSEEVVKVPPDAFALIALRTRTKFKGLVNVSGFHADPGYHGRLIFAVFNAGPGDVHLRQGDDLFTISFATLDVTTIKPRSDEDRFLHIPSELINPIAGEVQSFAGLKENIDEVQDDLEDRLHSIEREVGILRWALPLALSLVIGLLVRLFSLH